MNKKFLKRQTDAHSWLGLIISGLLFVVFFAGAISLFRTQLTQWSMQPHFELSQGQRLPLSQIMAIAIKDQPFEPSEHLTLRSPEPHMPYYLAYVDIEHQAGEADMVAFYIDPVTGQKVAKIGDFFFADFIYKLHLDLNLPGGEYVVGLVTLGFFFALVSGILIYVRKLLSSFFKYRTEQGSRSKLLDLHNMVGVMSLPLTLMYAITGLIFNLVIIYQIAFAVVLYQGDQQALLDDAGYKAISPTWQSEPWQAPSIDVLHQQVSEKYGAEPWVARIHNYGDASAVVQFIGATPHSLTDKYDIAYRLQDNSILYVKDQAKPNTLVTGLYVMSTLHFGNYGGFDLRFIYFFLALGVCALIVTGNLLWLDKRSRQRVYSATNLTVATNLTLWSTGGLVFATAVALVSERILPITLINRADYMVDSFIVSWVLSGGLILIGQNKKRCLAWLLQGAAGLLLAVVAIDWLIFYDQLVQLWRQGVTTVIAIEIGLVVVALILLVSGKQLRLTGEKVPVQHSTGLAPSVTVS